MNVLCICDYGINRSVHVASVLKFSGHDAIAAGIETSSPDTLRMLGEWADKIVLTDDDQAERLAGIWTAAEEDKYDVWPIGPDVFPRPFNKSLLVRVKALAKKGGYVHQ